VPSLADGAAVESALIAQLSGDAALHALMPDGVFIDLAPSGRTRFVIVSLEIHHDNYQFRSAAFEEATYLVKAVERSTSPSNANDAAARIHELLEDVALTIDGYTHMVTERLERVVYTDVDPENQDTRWQHRGGRYAVWVSPP